MYRYKHCVYICRNKNEKIEIMKLQFTVEGTNEFGWFSITRKCIIESNSSNEDIFRSCWKSLPKRLDKGWESISFINEGETIEVCKHWLEETGLDFSQSHTVVKLNH